MRELSRKILVGALVAGSLATGAVCAGAPAVAGEGYQGAHAKGYGRHGNPQAHMERMAERLNLTAEQRTAMREIFDRTRPQMGELRDKLADNRQQLRTLGQGTTVDEAQVRRLADAQGQLMAEMIVLRTKMRSEINAILTEEQRQQLKELGERRGHRRGA